MQKIIIPILIIVLLLSFSTVSYAHPGRTDSYGCHTCKTNCPNWGLNYGEYHCHNSKGVSQPKEPIKSTHGEGGTGYIRPAPEYKKSIIDTSKQNTKQSSKTKMEKESLKISPVVEPVSTDKQKENWLKILLNFF